MKPQVIAVPYRYDEFEEGLGLGPGSLLKAGLQDRAESVATAHLNDADREDDRTAINIGMLGKSTAALVARSRSSGAPVLVLAGDDTAAVGVVSGIQKADGASRALGVVWIDAHGDFNTPDTSYSGILAGMPLAVIAGLAGPRWREAAELDLPVAADRLLLLGLREIDKAEEELLKTHAVSRLTTEQLRTVSVLNDAIEALARRSEILYVNIDLDVLDPHVVPSITTPSAGGLEIEELSAILTSLVQTGKVAVVSVSSLNPGAGARGQRSVQAAWQVIEGLLNVWSAVPSPPQ
jgi:arginase